MGILSSPAGKRSKPNKPPSTFDRWDEDDEDEISLEVDLVRHSQPRLPVLATPQRPQTRRGRPRTSSTVHPRLGSSDVLSDSVAVATDSALATRRLSVASPVASSSGPRRRTLPIGDSMYSSSPVGRRPYTTTTTTIATTATAKTMAKENPRALDRAPSLFKTQPPQRNQRRPASHHSKKRKAAELSDHDELDDKQQQIDDVERDLAYTRAEIARFDSMIFRKADRLDQLGKHVERYEHLKAVCDHDMVKSMREFLLEFEIDTAPLDAHGVNDDRATARRGVGMQDLPPLPDLTGDQSSRRKPLPLDLSADLPTRLATILAEFDAASIDAERLGAAARSKMEITTRELADLQQELEGAQKKVAQQMDSLKAITGDSGEEFE